MSAHRITTFYSYKGGVGRSMALANIATILALRQETVLVVDFDLEAPGLHRYFVPSARGIDEGATARPEPPRGVIDLFEELQNRLYDRFPTEGSYDPSDPETIAVCRAIVNEVVDTFRGCTMPIGDGTQSIQFLPAGRFDEQYQDRIRHFDWVSFYETFKEAFDLLRDAWKERYEHVFIDSRTGLTDIGSVTTMILPDRLVVVFTPNEQSLHGAVEIARQAMKAKAKISPEPLAVFPLLARVDPADTDRRLEWLKKIAQRWSAFFGKMCNWPDFDWLRYFEDVHIPHNASFAYGERIAVAELLAHRGGSSLAQAFTAFASTLGHDTMASWFSTTRPTLEPSHDRALLIAFDADVNPPQRFSFETIFRVPESSTVEQRQALRTSGNPDAWRNAAMQIDHAIKEALRGLRGSLHVFVMAPYAAAVLAGRLLDEYARATPVHVHQFDSILRDWVAFSAPSFEGARGTDALGDLPWYDDVDAAERHTKGNVSIVAIDGSRQLAESALTSLASQLNTNRIVRLRQREPAAIASFAQARQAVRAIRKTLEDLQHKHPESALHIVTTAPVALMVELGRMLSSSVYRSVIVHQYEPQTGSYFPALDVMKPFEPVLVSGAKVPRTRRTPKKKS